jgi:hypothetical protein
MNTKIKGNFSCDNSYAVYLGEKSKVNKLLLQASNTQAAQIFNGEEIEFEASENDYLYLIAWSDDQTYQGLIGSFSGSSTINTGNQNWQVLPTNSNKATNVFPSSDEINKFLKNAADSDWKLPFVGSKNVEGGLPYKQVVKNIPEDANWIWFDSEKDKGKKYPSSPYVPFRGFNHDEFLIFRLPIKEMAPGTPTPPGPQQDRHNCCPQPIIVQCCCKEDDKPTIPPPPVEEHCCCGTCVFEVRFQRWRYISGSPGLFDGQAEIKFTCHVNGNMYNYPATNGSWVALNKRNGSYPSGWRAANTRVGIVEVPCKGKLGIDIMTELTEVAKKEGGISFEGGEPYGTSDVSTTYFECGKKPEVIHQIVKLEHAGNHTEDLELQVEYRFSQVTSCSCCGC